MEKIDVYSEAERRGDSSQFYALDLSQRGVKKKVEAIVRDLRPNGEYQQRKKLVTYDEYGNKFFEVGYDPEMQQFVSLFLKDLMPVCDIVKTDDGKFWSREFKNNLSEVGLGVIEAELALLELFTNNSDRGWNIGEERDADNMFIKRGSMGMYSRSYFDLEGDIPFLTQGNGGFVRLAQSVLEPLFEKYENLDKEYLLKGLEYLASRYSLSECLFGKETEAQKTFYAILDKTNMLNVLNRRDRCFLLDVNPKEIYFHACEWINVCYMQLQMMMRQKD